MIQFNFTVSDVDATNIFDCINCEISRLLADKVRNIAKINTSRDQKKIEKLRAEIDFFTGHIDYLNSLKKKMTNKRLKKTE